VTRLLADSSKAERLAGWRARTSLEEGLRKTYEWIDEHLDQYRPKEYAV
jgi:UDP-glucose 4-epimerase